MSKKGRRGRGRESKRRWMNSRPRKKIKQQQNGKGRMKVEG